MPNHKSQCKHAGNSLQERSLTFIIGDACSVNVTDDSFDVAFSNSVIEHVGNFSRQKESRTQLGVLPCVILCKRPIGISRSSLILCVWEFNSAQAYLQENCAMANTVGAYG